MILTKEQIAEYELILQGSKDESFGIALTDILTHRLTKAKAELVTATEMHDIFRWQGRADVLESLLKSLKVPRGTTQEV